MDVKCVYVYVFSWFIHKCIVYVCLCGCMLFVCTIVLREAKHPTDDTQNTS